VNLPKTEPTLEQRIIGVMRFRHYSRQTEQGYVVVSAGTEAS
jgi:hypothetical protein